MGVPGPSYFIVAGLVFTVSWLLILVKSGALF